MPQVGIKEFFAFDSNTFVQASAQMGQNTIRREITRLSCRPSLTMSSFAQPCHSERSEESRCPAREILRIVIILRDSAMHCDVLVMFQ